jgi:deoxyribose-phosphate aldolase
MTGPGVAPGLAPSQYAKHLDMALHLQSLTEQDIRAAAAEARAAGVAAFYTNSYWVGVVADVLAGCDVRVGSAIAFPYGSAPTRVKIAEIEASLEAGATAVDMVVNIGALRGGDLALVETEVAELRRRCAGRALTKLIFEVGFLTDDEIVTLTRICCGAGIDYVKTSTGTETFPNEAQVRLMLQHTADTATRVKVSGLPRTFTLAATLWMLELGVELMGTRSAALLVRQYADLYAGSVRADDPDEWLKRSSGDSGRPIAAPSLPPRAAR